MKNKAHTLRSHFIEAALAHISRLARYWEQPIVGTFIGSRNAAFKILISTVLSLRTKDKTTAGASLRLFSLADNPTKMLKLTQLQIEKVIYPVGFYRTKAKNIQKICRLLRDNYSGKVPDQIDTLLQLPGVGRKTANLVVTLAYRKPGICVDTHVHRISNRWGLVKTSEPDETEQALRKILPLKYWIRFNDLLVSFGQNLCFPVSPHCSRCPIAFICPKINVHTHR